jgi:hypothetical protein
MLQVYALCATVTGWELAKWSQAFFEVLDRSAVPA